MLDDNITQDTLPLDDQAMQFNWSTMNEGPYHDSITYATSTDLLNWTPSDKVLATHASVPGAVMKDGTIFVYFVDVSQDGIKEQLGMIKSEDEGATWSVPTTLNIEGLGDKATADPAPILLPDGRIRLYYFDINGPRLNKPASGIEPPQKIYSAISDDGINFVQEDGVRLEYNGAFDPDVEYVDGRYYIYVGSLQGNSVAVAQSPDGLNFTEPTLAYQGGAVPDVYYEDGVWYLYTAGINIATSNDGLTFANTGDHFQDPASRVTADPSVIPLSNEYYLMVYKIQ